MAQFTVTVNALVNGAPTAIGFNTIYVDDPLVPGFYIIDPDELTTDTTPPYVDPEGDAPATLKIITLPNSLRGTIEHDGVTIVLGDLPYELPWQDVIDGKLSFLPVDIGVEFVESFEFDIADVGSAQFSGLNDGRLLLSVGVPRNLPATIGDGEADVAYQGTLVFTRAMFTTQTTPPYNDPEGDAAFQLKILSLPLIGRIELDGNPIVVNQVINFSDIDTEKLTYVSDNVDDTNGDIQNFTFSIADVGSGEFTE